MLLFSTIIIKPIKLTFSRYFFPRSSSLKTTGSAEEAISIRVSSRSSCTAVVVVGVVVVAAVLLGYREKLPIYAYIVYKYISYIIKVYI